MHVKPNLPTISKSRLHPSSPLPSSHLPRFYRPRLPPSIPRTNPIHFATSTSKPQDIPAPPLPSAYVQPALSLRHRSHASAISSFAMSTSAPSPNAPIADKIKWLHEGIERPGPYPTEADNLEKEVEILAIKDEQSSVEDQIKRSFFNTTGSQRSSRNACPSS